MKYYITLDVGGTQIKGGILTTSAQLLDDKIWSFDARSKESREIILTNFFYIIDTLIDSITGTDKEISGIGFAFPGEFNYKEGICLMRNVDKYDSIYSVNIRTELAHYIVSGRNAKFFQTDCPILFLNDIEAFALGESCMGLAKDYDTILAVCIGTGAGSAFLRDGNTLDSTEPGVPDHGWIYDYPFLDSILDDYLSRRGLMNISQAYIGEALDGKPLADLANSGDIRAIQAFRHFGQNILDGLIGFLSEFHPRCLILGGQIMKSFPLFGEPITEYCNANNIKIQISTNTSLSAFWGLYSSLIKVEYS